jgi:predicted component of type VI protein secretion system
MSTNDEVLSGEGTGEPNPQPEADAPAEPEPQSEPEHVDYFADDAVEPAAAIEPDEPTEASQRRPSAASLGDHPAFRKLARDAERTVSSILGSYDFGAAGQMRQLQTLRARPAEWIGCRPTCRTW